MKNKEIRKLGLQFCGLAIAASMALSPISVLADTEDSFAEDGGGEVVSEMVVEEQAYDAVAAAETPVSDNTPSTADANNTAEAEKTMTISEEKGDDSDNIDETSLSSTPEADEEKKDDNISESEEGVNKDDPSQKTEEGDENSPGEDINPDPSENENDPSSVDEDSQAEKDDADIKEKEEENLETDPEEHKEDADKDVKKEDGSTENTIVSEADNISSEGKTSYYAGAGTYNAVSYGVMQPDFRFVTVEKEYGFINGESKILEDTDPSADIVGNASANTVVFILDEIDVDGNLWYYVESGPVRGFIQQDKVISGDAAEELKTLLRIDENADLSGRFATATKPYYDNTAYTYTKTTTVETIIDKVYAVSKKDNIEIKEEKADSGRTIGILKKEDISYIILDENDQWLYIESGNVRGFAHRDDMDFSNDIQDKYDEEGEGTISYADESIDYNDNKALYYTLTSVKAGSVYSQSGQTIISYANSFVGNPYVWGGNSLTDGCDCSHFVYNVLKDTIGYDGGYETSSNWADNGIGISSLGDAAAGDVLVWDGHVAFYDGNGHVVEAQDSLHGITNNRDAASAISSGNFLGIRRISSSEAVTGQGGIVIDIPEGLGNEHTYMGWQCITSPSSNQYRLREAAGMNFDSEGFGIINGRYVIACTSTYGDVGDYIDFYQADGTIIPCIIGDEKNQSDAGCTVWGHSGGNNIVEFVVDRDTWYTGHVNPGNAACHPEWNQNIIKAVRLGNYFD